MNTNKSGHNSLQIFDSRDLKKISDKDKEWRCNSTSTLQRVNEIMNEPNSEYLDKLQHGLDWEGFAESTPNIATSFSIKGSKDGVTAEYRNPEKKLVPGILDTPPISSKKSYEEGVHVFQFDLKSVSPIDHNSNLNVYIGIEAQNKEDRTKKFVICKWWLSLTKYMFMQLYTRNPQRPRIYQYPLDTLEMPEQVFMALDMNEGTLGFIVNNEYLGPAYGGLCGLRISPVISYYGNADYDISMKYMNSIDPSSLKRACGRFVRKLVSENGRLGENINLLDIPVSLKQYLTNV